MSNAIRDYFTRRSPASGRVILGVWLASYLSASTPALALPQDGQVTHGQGSIEATSASTMEIRQASERMAASFSSFDIAAQEAVNVDQPGASSVFLGNISGESATTIFGTLTANGSVMLVNPRGVVFGKGSRVDTASLIASSLGVDVDDFMSGALELEFSADMAGRIVNRGVIQAAKGGSVTLMGDEVINEGLIVAEMGRVDLASGSEAVLTFDQDRLIGLKVTKSALGDLGGDTAVLNSGTIEADGGQIFLSADAARDLFSRAVQNEGILRAKRAEEVNGEIVLSSTGDTWNSGRIEATADSGTGGSVQVLGDRVAVSGEIDASGADGGGEILVGGDFQGKGDTQTAKKTYVGPDAELKADATEEGDGGRVIVWADDATQFFGSLSARGGEQGGDGGFAEVSGKGSLVFEGRESSPAEGHHSQLLLDPTDVYIFRGLRPVRRDRRGRRDLLRRRPRTRLPRTSTRPRSRGSSTVARTSA
ncbi:MAG: filamentous hemagglutinin N-terminal domain-containing protein [Gammaproteobacteria bacterium]|nr:filamentous hemagglutinin N-terminal domain-containing protein [Gammaproteobacteria bacterium]